MSDFLPAPGVVQEDGLKHNPPDSGPELLAFVDTQMERIANLRREISENVQIADLRKAKHDEWLAEVNAGREREIARTETMLRSIAGRITFTGNAKSKRLAFGTIGRHKAKDAVEVTDPARAVDFARTYSLPYAAAVKTQDVGEIEKLRAAAHEIGLRLLEAPLKAPLLAFVDENGFEVDAAEHGFKVLRGENVPFVKVNDPWGAANGGSANYTDPRVVVGTGPAVTVRRPVLGEPPVELRFTSSDDPASIPSRITILND